LSGVRKRRNDIGLPCGAVMKITFLRASEEDVRERAEWEEDCDEMPF
jgi:hypothetical protein